MAVLTWEADGDDEDEACVPETARLCDVERCGHGGVKKSEDETRQLQVVITPTRPPPDATRGPPPPV